MKTRIIGLLIFLFFIAVPFILEGGNIPKLFLPSSLLIVFGPTAGLVVASLKKGQGKKEILKRAKKYLIYSGFIGAVVALIGIFAGVPVSPDGFSAPGMFHKLSSALNPILLGLVSTVIVDTFIE